MTMLCLSARGAFVIALDYIGSTHSARWWSSTPRLPVFAAAQVLVTELPILQVVPIEANKLKLANTFRAPVYVTQARRDAMGHGLIFEADLATQEHPSHWVLQGVALVANTD